MLSDEGSGRNVIPKYALSGQRKGQEMTEAVATELPTHGVNLTEVAQNKVRTLLEQEGRTDLRLRIAVQPGGCSALSTSCTLTSVCSTAMPYATMRACRLSLIK